MLNPHTNRVAHATAHSLCLVCANYGAPFKKFTSICRMGGLDPANAAPTFAEMTTDAVARYRSRATVEWANSCPRFASARELAA